MRLRRLLPRDTRRGRRRRGRPQRRAVVLRRRPGRQCARRSGVLEDHGFERVPWRRVVPGGVLLGHPCRNGTPVHSFVGAQNRRRQSEPRLEPAVRRVRRRTIQSDRRQPERGWHRHCCLFRKRRRNVGDRIAGVRLVCGQRRVDHQGGPVSAFSDVAPSLSLVAPGESIVSSVLFGGYGALSGTSMAAAHVTGAFAVVRQALPAADVTTILDASVGLAYRLPIRGLLAARPRLASACSRRWRGSGTFRTPCQPSRRSRRPARVQATRRFR